MVSHCCGAVFGAYKPGYVTITSSAGDSATSAKQQIKASVLQHFFPGRIAWPGRVPTGPHAALHDQLASGAVPVRRTAELL